MTIGNEVDRAIQSNVSTNLTFYITIHACYRHGLYSYQIRYKKWLKVQLLLTRISGTKESVVWKTFVVVALSQPRFIPLQLRLSSPISICKWCKDGIPNSLNMWGRASMEWIFFSMSYPADILVHKNHMYFIQISLPCVKI